VLTALWKGVERGGLRRRSPRMERAQQGQRPDPLQPAGTERLPQIKHIVVLMMENHSFDNYLGTLGRGEGLPRGADGQPDAENPDAAGQAVRAYHLPSTTQHSGVPCQSWHATHQQWGEGKCDGFVTSAQEVQAAARAGTAADPVDTAPEAATVGLTSGASVPEELVAGVLGKLAALGFADVEEIEAVKERMVFQLPRELRSPR